MKRRWHKLNLKIVTYEEGIYVLINFYYIFKLTIKEIIVSLIKKKLIENWYDDKRRGIKKNQGSSIIKDPR